VNGATDLGVTPLWTACENGSAAMVERLLQAGANPNAALVSGETPLMTAARTGNATVVNQLLAKGADVSAKESTRGQTALMWAVAQQHPDVVEILLAHRADVHARSSVWTQVVKTTQEARNPPSVMDVEQGGYTPLLFAARGGDLASAKLLLAAGADVNVTAPYGTSALVVAAHSGHGELAAFLLEKGADPNMNGAGYNALHISIRRQDEKLVRALLAHGADPNTPLLKGTPTRRGFTDVHLPPSFVGATPFWLAARYGAPTIMRLLAEYGADPLVVHHLAYWAEDEGYKLGQVIEGDTTALMAAAGMGDRLRTGDEKTRLEAVKVAAELGVDVNAANADGNTALHVVAARGSDTIVKFLVEEGARLDVTNKKGQTPLAAAMAAPRAKSTVELLRTLGAKG
jgi:ankyrin repeat protein